MDEMPKQLLGENGFLYQCSLDKPRSRIMSMNVMVRQRVHLFEPLAGKRYVQVTSGAQR